MNDLEKEILRHRKLYYSEYNPEISDLEYDILCEKLRKQKPNSPIFKNIGYAPKRNKIALPVILGSLDNISIARLGQWLKAKNDSILASLKADGLSIFVEYENGKLKLLSTRGDGKTGEDITYKARKIKGLPLTINKKGKFLVRGEAVVKNNPPKNYKTRRSAAIGIIGRDDLKHINYITPIFYELISCNNLPKTASKRLKMLSDLNFITIPSFLFSKKDVINRTDDVVDKIVKILEQKNEFDFDIDGIVLTANHSKRENIKIPKNSIAFKIDNVGVRTKVIDVKWQMGRTGRITPVVIIDAIKIDNVEINHPTGHNYKWIAEKKIGKGAIIEVIRSGDVIPKITKVIKPAKIPPKPKKCPFCKSFLKQDGVNLVCTSKTCKEHALMKVDYFIKTLGAENISTPTLRSLKIFSIRKFYQITKEEIESTNGFQKTKTSLFLRERNKTLRTTEAELLTAFGLPFIGIQISKQILNNIGLKLEDIILLARKNEEKLYEMLLDIDRIGVKIAEYFVENIKQYDSLLKFLKKKGLKFKKEKISYKLKGKTFQFTGAMSLKREDMKKLVINNGGKLSNSMNKIDYLVTASMKSNSTKMKKARKHNVKIISENKFLKMVGKK